MVGFSVLKKKWLPVEWVVFVYLLISGSIIILADSLDHRVEHLAFRIGILLIMVTMTLPKDTKFLRLGRITLPFVLLGLLYKETDYLNNLLFTDNLDIWICQLEEWLFNGQPSLTFALKYPSEWFAELMYFGYFSYYLMIVGVPAYVYFIKGDIKAAEKYAFMIIAAFMLYYLFFIIIPVAGPQYYFTNLPALPQGYAFGKIMRIIQHNGEAPTAAFPSSHVSICLMLIWISAKEAKRLVLWLMIIGIVLIFSTVYIRAHYLIDIVAAVLFTPVVVVISYTLYSFISKFSYGLDHHGGRQQARSEEIHTSAR